jgi:spore coat polysaccharide biosynthesis protein SpsF
MPRVVLIVQARMGSTRLPGKVLKEILGRPILELQLERLEKLKEVDEIVVATSTNAEDNAIENFCSDRKIEFFRGHPTDVLSRFYEAAAKQRADVVIRSTGDCPLIDPGLCDQVIGRFLELKDFIYVANVGADQRTFPRGLDIEVFSFKALEQAHKEASSPSDREHVTLYVSRKAQSEKKFEVVRNSVDYSKHRWTVDTAEDFELIKRIFEELYPRKKNFNWKDVLQLLSVHPDWVELNQHIAQKAH